MADLRRDLGSNFPKRELFKAPIVCELGLWRNRCRLTVGVDLDLGVIRRFLAKLHCD